MGWPHYWPGKCLSSSSRCFLRGGLGVGEKPTRGELVQSTHRVPHLLSPPSNFLSRPFGWAMTFYGAGNSLWPFPPRCVSSVCVERSRVSTPERATREWPTQYQRSRRSLRELCGVTADPSRAGDRTLSPAGSRMPVETPSQRDPAAAPEERGVVIFAGTVSMKFWE